jgi:aldehyde dehydrogenase (NAD+)
MPVASRKTQLRQIAYLLEDNSDAIAAALEADLGKRPFEAYLTEIQSALNA